MSLFIQEWFIPACRLAVMACFALPSGAVESGAATAIHTIASLYSWPGFSDFDVELTIRIYIFIL